MVTVLVDAATRREANRSGRAAIKALGYSTRNINPFSITYVALDERGAEILESQTVLADWEVARLDAIPASPDPNIGVQYRFDRA